MDPSPDTPSNQRPRQPFEYEDPHYHDEIDVVVPADDVEHPGKPRLPGKRKPTRRPPPPRRRYED